MSNFNFEPERFEVAFDEFLPDEFEFDEWFSAKPPLAKKGVAAAWSGVKPKVGPTKGAAMWKGGMSPEKVCWIQSVLNKTQGERLATDGIYGPLTREAVRRFQARNSLSVDGVVGPQAETALIQSALNNIAQASLVPVNGAMDTRTRQEIQRFQSRSNLVSDDIVGPKTRAAMVVALGGKCIVRPPSQKHPTPSPHPVRPGSGWTQGCDRAEFDRLSKQCYFDYAKCTGSCGLDYVINQIKLVPALRGCLSLVNPYAIVLCALARGGAKYIDNIFAIKECLEDCGRSREFCELNARSSTRCR